MSLLRQFFSNKAIMIPAMSWFIAQFIKVVCVIIKENKLDFTRFVGSGGMPSSHSSFMVSLATVIAKHRGLDSLEFGIAFAVSLIVMYDAAGVRRAAGKQAEVLNKLIYCHDYKINFEGKLKELLGHSPLEVSMGAALGIFIGIWFG